MLSEASRAVVFRGYTVSLLSNAVWGGGGGGGGSGTRSPLKTTAWEALQSAFSLCCMNILNSNDNVSFFPVTGSAE